MLIDNYLNDFKNTIFICLFTSTIFYWANLRIPQFKILYILASLTSQIANLSLFGFLALRWVNCGYFPLSNLYESLLFLSCLLLSAQQILEYQTQSKLFGSIIVPLVLFITGLADLNLPLELQKANALVPALQSNWLMMHVSLMMLSYATLLLGSLFSIIFLVCFSILPYIDMLTSPMLIFDESEKRFTKRFKKMLEFYLAFNIKQNFQNDLISPEIDRPLATGKSSIFSLTLRTVDFLINLDNWSYRAISFGFPVLTIGIIAGAVWANEAWGSYWSWDPKETWALITWLVFAAYLHVRLNNQWSVQGPAILASIGFFIVWVCYLGVNFLGQGLHSYGWFS